MSMNDDCFEGMVSELEALGLPVKAKWLRERDTAQREALVRMEAELAECSRAHAGLVDEIRAFHAQQPWLLEAKLAEAVGLLKELRPTIPKDVLSLWCIDRDAFLARHVQAEQQESQGAQAVDERAAVCEAVRKAAKEFGEKADEDGLQRDAFGEFFHEEPKYLLRICQLYRAALATQPAEDKDGERYRAIRDIPDVWIGVIDNGDLKLLEQPQQIDQLADNAVLIRSQVEIFDAVRGAEHE